MFKFLTESGYELSEQKDILDAFTASIGKSALWVALAIALTLIIVGIIINFKFRSKFRAFLVSAISIIVGFAIALSFVLLYVTFTRMKLNGDFTPHFWLLFGFGVTSLTLIVTCSLLKIFKIKWAKYAVYSSLAIILAYAIVLLCLLPTDSDTTPTNYPLYISLSAILIVAIAVGGFFGDLKREKTDNTKSLTYAGICIAVSYGLSYIKFIDMPAGGSITLISMLPIMLYAYMFGTRKGVITSLVYGILQSMQDPQIYEPLQVLLDYPVAFAGLGLAGLFKGRKFLKGNHILEFLLGILVAGIFRYTAHVLSGYFVFYSWAEWSEIQWLKDSPILYSVIYNSAILIDVAIDAVMGAILFSSKSLMRFVNAVNPTTTTVSETESDTDNTENLELDVANVNVQTNDDKTE